MRLVPASDLAGVAALPVVEPRLHRQLVLGHPDQQADQLRRFVEVVLPRGSADEEAGQHTLADVHRVEVAIQGRIGQPGPDRHADGGLVGADQLLRSSHVAGADAADERGERRRVGHGERSRRAGLGLTAPPASV
jgi:hypothetical protein